MRQFAHIAADLSQGWRGSNAVVLFHDGEHGDDIIDALARFGTRLAGE